MRLFADNAKDLLKQRHPGKPEAFGLFWYETNFDMK